ncbi:MAG TPA: DUF5818 domain-containing protein [Thermoanaerobaculia bacterium]|nr:DUF5818 domain-containing protein [Thermoanaerobaculia bacterium]
MRQLATTLCLLLAAACAANGGGGPGAIPVEPVEDEVQKGKGTGTVTVTGRLTDEGVECQALRGDDGQIYTLTGDLQGFKVGDRVRVTGRPAEMSFCMQGTTLTLHTIEQAPSSD